MINIPQPALALALKRLFFALDVNSKLEGLTHIRVDAYENLIKLSAKCPRISAEALVQLDETRKDRITFGTSGALFRDLVKSFAPDAAVNLTLDGMTLVVKAGTSAFKLPIMEDLALGTYDYSQMDFKQVNMPSFIKGLSRVVFCSNKGGAHDYQKGVCIDKAHYVATDGFRLVCHPNQNVTLSSNVLLPKDSVESLVKMFSQCKEGGVAVESSAVHVYGDGLYASVRTMAGVFPDYKSIIPVGKGVNYEVPVQVLLTPLKRLMIVANDKFPTVRLSFKSDLKALYMVTESGTSKGFEAIAFTPAIDQDVRLNLGHLIDSLEAIDDEVVTLEFFAPPQDGMAIIKSGEYFHVLTTIVEGT